MKGYKDTITSCMTRLGQDPRRRFVGYNVRCGRFGGTLAGVPEDRLLETPVAENLMTGIAIGMAIEGYKPVLCFERFDFVLNAMDAIVNHLDKLPSLSGGKFNPHVLIRVVVGNHKKPLYTGPTHTQNLSAGLRKMVSFPVIEARTAKAVKQAWHKVERHMTAAVVEFKENY